MTYMFAKLFDPAVSEILSNKIYSFLSLNITLLNIPNNLSNLVTRHSNHAYEMIIWRVELSDVPYLPWSLYRIVSSFYYERRF